MTKSDDPIRFEGVWRRYGDRTILRGLDLRVRPGQIHALLGRNGCGKTTALRVLLGFLAPHAGRAVVLGKDSRLLTPDDRGRIGYVCEDHRLVGAMRVTDVIAFEAGTRPRFDVGWARTAALRCGLSERARVMRLSRGQRAQLALVIAAASRPDVLVCDDPALGLDVVMRRELLDVMIDLLGSRGVSVLFSSHILTDVERIADRVSILHEGRLVVDATVDDVKRRVQRRAWVPATPGAAPPQVPGLLRADKRHTGYELTLRDPDEGAFAALRAAGSLGEGAAPTLEELFFDVTRGDGPRLVPPVTEEEAAA
jgi:ABC-2 type transport system ATP-binding protein